MGILGNNGLTVQDIAKAQKLKAQAEKAAAASKKPAAGMIPEDIPDNNRDADDTPAAGKTGMPDVGQTTFSVTAAENIQVNTAALRAAEKKTAASAGTAPLDSLLDNTETPELHNIGIGGRAESWPENAPQTYSADGSALAASLPADEHTPATV